MEKIRIDSGKCIACGDCVKVCPSIFAPEGEMIRIVEEEHCTLCGHCLAVCPTEAIDHADLDKEEFNPLPPDSDLSSEKVFSFLRSRRSCRAYTEEVGSPRPPGKADRCSPVCPHRA